MSNTFGRVVVGVDGSPGSLQALRFAVGHARTFGSALVPVLAWTPPGGELANRRYQVASLNHEWQVAAEQRLYTAFDEGLGGRPDDLDLIPHVLRGPAAALLVAVADRPDDLLIVGAGRRGIVRRAIQGSVSRYCVARAACTVIAVPPSQLAEKFNLGHSWSGLRARHELWEGIGALDHPAGTHATH